MPSLLFVAPADLGEAVLSTGALAHVLTLETATTVLCAADAATLFRGVPGLQRTLVSRRRGLAMLADLAMKARSRHFDRALDLSGTRVGLIARAKERAVRGAPCIMQHRIEDFAQLVKAQQVRPKLWLDAQAREDAAGVSPGSPLIALAPFPEERDDQWPLERFAAAARRLIGAGPLAGAHVVVMGALGDADAARFIVSSLEADGIVARSAAGRLDLLASAAVLERATLCLAAHSAFMHIAATVGVPTLALFGRSDERVHGPFGARAGVVRAKPYDEVEAAHPAPEGRSSMAALSVDAVEQAALDLLSAGGLK